MLLYGSSFSPFVRKVLAFAAEKGIELENKPLPLGSDDPGFLAASPFRKFPGLEDGDFRISDSSAIVHYLEAKFPEPALIPPEPRDRARTIWWDEFADTLMFDCIRKLFFNRVISPRFLQRPGDLESAERAEAKELPPLLDHLEANAPAPDGFLVTDRITLADLAVASPFVNLRHTGVALDRDRHPGLSAWVDAMLARPSFATWIARETRFMERTAAA